MMPHSNRRTIFKLATAAGRQVLETLQRAYDTHMERAQMRLAPAKSRSWHDIPRARAHHDYY